MMRPLVAVACMALSSVLCAAEPSTLDPAGARRAADLAAQLRCLVCQNQSIAESNAELAVDLRRQIDEQIRAGRSDREITNFMVARYGDFVLYRPPFKLSTLLLWLGPVLLALIALLILGRTVRARRARPVPVPLTTAERDEATRLLENGKSGDHR